MKEKGDWRGEGEERRREEKRGEGSERKRALVSTTSGKNQSKRPGTAIPHAIDGIISADRKWHLQVASSFGRKTRRLPDDVVPRG